MRILLVEDTLDVGEAIEARFRRLGHTVDWDRDGALAEAVHERDAYDLVILDVMLPGRDGLRLLKEMRRRGLVLPVLVLTARSLVDDRVGALDLGADDYLVKPFDFRELEARVRALLRRGQGAATNILSCGALRLDRASRTATIGGEPVALTRRELTLLELLAGRIGRVFGKDELIDQLFGLEEAGSENAVEQTVARLRRKLAGAGVEIRTLRGLGYQMVVS